MFPIGDDNHGARGVPVVTVGLIAVNVLVYLYQLTLSLPDLQSFIVTYGAIPAEIERGTDLYTLLTSMFVHGGFAHIAGNMLFLWIFGDNIEQRFGPILYLLFYVGTGLAASGAHILTDPTSPVPTVGASGAISGVMGAYILLYPLNRVRTFIWYVGTIYVPAFIYLGIWFLTQLISGAAALSVPTAQSEGVAFWAHIGGFAAGVVVALLLRPLRPEPPRRQQVIFTRGSGGRWGGWQ
ncbi:MAG: rhomboid family intramembrane serine protease [Anaerolineae bacterium]|nr:rhomboid family intramembrane serine protease [Anaerolineae bacterium]